MTLEEALRKVWRATMVEHAPAVELEGQTFPVRTTPKKRLREVDFVFDHQELRGLEQNPETASRWAQLAGLAERDTRDLRDRRDEIGV